MPRTLTAAVVLSLCGSAAALFAATPPRPPIVDYRIDVRLDPATKTLTGKERLIWRNPSADTIRELQFHLYLNAFRNDKTTFMKESGGRLRGDHIARDKNPWGWTTVKRMSVEGDGDVTSRIRFLQPDTPERDDRTVAAVSLQHPVPPHGTAVIDVDFEARLPLVFARSGYVRDFYMVGQWFPKIGVYEPAGLRHRFKGGWNCHQYHAYSEFYADYGNFDVTVSTPENFVVGGSGELVSIAKKGNLVTRRYVSHDVHDFAWSADPRFRVFRYRFDPQRDVPAAWRTEASRLLGISESDLQLRPVDVTFYMQPDHLGSVERYKRSLNGVMAFCGLRYGPYPYPTLTLIDPPEDAGGASGMEYPGLFTADTRKAFEHWPFDRIRLPEIVTVHEFGHEYWYGMVGSNEFEESWMDEGINSFTEGEVMEAMHPDGAYVLPNGISITSLASFRGSYLGAPPRDAIVKPSWKYAGGNSFAANSYAKPALILRQLERDLGAPRFARALRAYFEQYRFSHPDTRDFFASFERTTGRDLSVYEKNFFYGTARVDVSVRSATTRATGGHYRSEVVVGRTGVLAMPVPVVFRFANGHVERRMFPVNARTVTWRFDYANALREVVADPQLIDLWDTDLLNNSRVIGRVTLAPAKITVRGASAAARILELLWSLV